MNFPSNRALKRHLTRLILGFAAVLLGQLPSQAEDKTPFQMTAELGFGNFIKAEHPLPFRLDISDVKKKVEGCIRVTCPNSNNGATIYEFPVALTPDSHKQWQLTLPPLAGNSVRVQVIDNDRGPVNTQDYFGILVNPESQFAVVVQDAGERRFAFPRTAAEPSPTEWRTGGIEPAALPENPLAYASVSAILWRSMNPQALNPAQARALLAWVKWGGVLVIGGGRVTPPALPPEFQPTMTWDAMTSFPLDNLKGTSLLPPLRPITMLAVNAKMRPWQPPATVNASVAIKPLQAPPSQVRLQAGETRLVGEEPLGAGVLMQLAFDPADMQSEGSMLDWAFWNEALRPPDPRLSIWNNMRWLVQTGADDGRTELARAADFRIAGPGYIATIYGTFFGLGFCLNFWAFRKSRRYEWAWCILLIAAVATFIFNRAYGRAGGLGGTRHVEVSRSFLVANESSLLSFTEMGLLSAGGGRATIETTSPSQILFSTDRQARTVELHPNKQVFRTRLQSGAFSTCSTVTMTGAPGRGFEANWKTVGQNLEIAMKDQTGLGVRHPTVVFNQSTTWRGNTLVVPVQGLHQTVQGILDKLKDTDALQSSWVAGNYSPSGNLNYAFRLPLYFSFEMPHNTSPSIRSEFPNYRLQNQVALLAPVAVELAWVTPSSQPVPKSATPSPSMSPNFRPTTNRSGPRFIRRGGGTSSVSWSTTTVPQAVAPPVSTPAAGGSTADITNSTAFPSSPPPETVVTNQPVSPTP
jgi:hypothetical protein